MGAVRKFLGVVFRRPFIVIYTGFLTLMFCIVLDFNPLTSLIMGFNRIGKGDFLESIIYTIQILYNSIFGTKNFFIGAAIFIVFLVVLSIILGVILSGFFNIVNKAVGGTPKSGREFPEGIKKFAFRTSWLLFRAIVICFLVYILILISTVPAVILTKAWLSGKVELIAVMALLDVITCGVVILGFMFLAIYITFWLPASFNFGKRAFTMGKRAADVNFWRIFVHYIIFGVVFLGSHMIISNIKVGATGTLTVSLFVIDWLIKTLIFCTYIIYLFSAFKRGQKSLRTEKEAL
jgi:hypothetical protein